MADNVSITAGSGTVIAADEVTRNAISEKQQLIKISYGTDGNYEGMVSTTTPLPIGGTTAQCIGKAEDAAHSSGDTGVFCLAVRSDSAATFGAAGDYCPVVVNSYGCQMVNSDYAYQQAAATGMLKKLSDTANATDAGTNILAVRRDTAASGGTDAKYQHLAANQYGSLRVDIDATFQNAATTGLLKLEDVAHASGDAGVMLLGVRADTPTSFCGAAGDYTPLQLGLYGGLIIDVQVDRQADNAKGLLKAEDSAAASGDAGVVTLVKRLDTPVANAGVGTDGDYATMILANEGGLWVSDSPTALGGLSKYKNISLIATGINVKATAGRLYKAVLINRATTQRYVKLYDKATAPTVGTDVPTDTFCLEPAAASGSKVLPLDFDPGAQFANGIGIAATTGIADADTGAPSANDVVVMLYYK